MFLACAVKKFEFWQYRFGGGGGGGPFGTPNFCQILSLLYIYLP